MSCAPPPVFLTRWRVLLTQSAPASFAKADHNVGIVIVLDRDRLAGVFSERDVVRRVLHQAWMPQPFPWAR